MLLSTYGSTSRSQPGGPAYSGNQAAGLQSSRSQTDFAVSTLPNIPYKLCRI